MSKRDWLQALCAGTILAGLALPAAAQTADTPAPAAEAAADDGEIVVTAQRRAERLVDVPISVTAVDGEALAGAGIIRMSDLDRAAPGLVFYVTASHASPTIRGVGSTLTGPGADNPVAVYVDGVYQSAASALLFEFDNISQIEVLRRRKCRTSIPVLAPR
jgi:iron complex outermembrane receptor protein